MSRTCGQSQSRWTSPEQVPGSAYVNEHVSDPGLTPALFPADTCSANIFLIPHTHTYPYKMSVLRPFKATDLFKFNNMYAVDLAFEI